MSDLVSNNPKIARVGIVAGETSGDILGASLMQALKARYPNLQFEGVGGMNMCQAGLDCLYPMEDLAVMGLIEPLKRLPRILAIRRGLYQHFSKNPPDIFIGIDSPDFNLTLEEKLKKKGICTIQYVGPTIWAWRPNRVHKIKRAADKVLVLFPFEKDHYDKTSIPVACVGHTLADDIPLENPKLPAREALRGKVDLGLGKSLEPNTTLVTILPGSRKGVLSHLSQPFIETAIWLQKRMPKVQFLVAFANSKRQAEFQQIFKPYENQLSIQSVVNQTRLAISASDAVLLSSGTGTLETMLLKRPMVVAYKMSRLTFAIAKRLVKVDNIALPNLLAGRPIVPEFIQHQISPEKMGEALLHFLQNKNNQKNLKAPKTIKTDDLINGEETEGAESTAALIKTFHKLHLSIRRNASENAADEILKTFEQNC